MTRTARRALYRRAVPGCTHVGLVRSHAPPGPSETPRRERTPVRSPPRAAGQVPHAPPPGHARFHAAHTRRPWLGTPCTSAARVRRSAVSGVPAGYTAMPGAKMPCIPERRRVHRTHDSTCPAHVGRCLSPPLLPRYPRVVVAVVPARRSRTNPSLFPLVSSYT